MLVTLGTYRAYNTKIQLLLAAVCLSGSSRPLKGGGSSFKQKFSVLRATVWSKNRGGGGAGLPWIGHCWSFYNFVDPLLRDPVMVTQDHRPEKNSKGR